MSLKQWIEVDHLTHPKPAPETPRQQEVPRQGLDTLTGAKTEELTQAVQDFKLSCQE